MRAMAVRQRLVNLVAGRAARFVDAVDRRRGAPQGRQAELIGIAATAQQTDQEVLQRLTTLQGSVDQLHDAVQRIEYALEHTIGASLGMVQGTADHVRRHVDETLPLVQHLVEAGHPQDAMLHAIRLRLEDTQMLVGTVRDDLAANDQRLAKARARDDYDAAWDDEQPLISIRIATYQNAKGLSERTLPTLIAQTYPRWECIVVGDAVTDDTAERIAALGDDRIRFENLPFRGPYPEDAARRRLVAGTAPANAGADAARGSWIAPLDHDDEFDVDHLEVLLAKARETRAEFVYGRMRIVEEETGKPAGEVGSFPPDHGKISLQGAMYHAALQREGIALDPFAWQAGEPGDWNLVRRIWSAGARFAFVDRAVGTYYRPTQLRQ